MKGLLLAAALLLLAGAGPPRMGIAASATGPAGEAERPPRAGRAREGWPGDAPYSVPRRVLDAARGCSQQLRPQGREAVLLVHGTGVTARLNFAWNYMPGLKAEGFQVCWVELPHAALGDIQVAAEYVARAVEVMARATASKVDVIGHSQGGLVPRWAARYFASGAAIDDLVMLAAPNHGTLAADTATATHRQPVAVWQMRVVAKLIAVLNARDETPGPLSYTSIYTAADELVQPLGTQALDGGTNILLQELCPGRAVDHVSIVADNLTWLLVLDALTEPGPADPARLPAAVCASAQMPYTTLPPLELPDWSHDTLTDREPPIKPYART
jgi:hypothetical protein